MVVGAAVGATVVASHGVSLYDAQKLNATSAVAVVRDAVGATIVASYLRRCTMLRI